ncbi:MAG: urease accessory protein UreD [Terriglobales bacterium]
MACAQQIEIGLEPAADTASRVEASLELDFEFDQAAGRTVLAASRQQAPLQVVRAFALEDGGALAHLHNVSGGLLGGDRLELRARVGTGANAQLTTTGATRIYRPRELAADAVQSNRISVGENALLEYVPDPIIPFAGARFRQQTTIKLAPGAGLFWWEILAPGREARGELFAYDRMELKMDIWTPNRLIAAERVRLEPPMHALSSLARLGDYRYWATFYICRVGAGPKLWATAEERLRAVAASVSPTGETRWGISTLAADGLVVRCLSRQGRWVLAGLREIWTTAKSLLYGREAIPPRKVN